MTFRFIFPNSNLATIEPLLRHISGIVLDSIGSGVAVQADVPFSQTRLFEEVTAANPSLTCVAFHRRFRQGRDFRNGDRPIGIFPDMLGNIVDSRWASSFKVTACPRCAADTGFRDPRELPHLTFLRKPTAHIFSDASLNVFASEYALDKITDAKLGAGLVALPVESEGNSNLRWFLFRGQQLSFPDGPFGRWNEVCHLCESYAPRRYQFGEIYLRPKEPAHWMSFPSFAYGEARILVSDQVYDWLLAPATALLSPRAIEFALHGRVCGWYPEDAGYFYLPRHLQSADAPVYDPAVLQFMTFDSIPLVGSPKRLIPAWRTDADNLGLFRNLDQALNWEHDTVFILDLTSTDTDSISSEDIAKFRNLRELVLRHTKVQTLPDAIFHLKNLNRIDIRDTPIPPAEIERIRSQLPARVKLVANRPRRTPS